MSLGSRDGALDGGVVVGGVGACGHGGGDAEFLDGRGVGVG